MSPSFFAFVGRPGLAPLGSHLGGSEGRTVNGILETVLRQLSASPC